MHTDENLSDTFHTADFGVCNWSRPNMLRIIRDYIGTWYTLLPVRGCCEKCFWFTQSPHSPIWTFTNVQKCGLKQHWSSSLGRGRGNVNWCNILGRQIMTKSEMLCLRTLPNVIFHHLIKAQQVFIHNNVLSFHLVSLYKPTIHAENLMQSSESHKFRPYLVKYWRVKRKTECT
jgi:hypothetical protein